MDSLTLLGYAGYILFMLGITAKTFKKKNSNKIESKEEEEKLDSGIKKKLKAVREKKEKLEMKKEKQQEIIEEKLDDIETKLYNSNSPEALEVEKTLDKVEEQIEDKGDKLQDKDIKIINEKLDSIDTKNLKQTNKKLKDVSKKIKESKRYEELDMLDTLNEKLRLMQKKIDCNN